jgi:protein xylosyltransferase
VNGRADRQLRRLIRQLFDGRSYFYIHVDARQDYMHRQIKKLSEKYPDLVTILRSPVSAEKLADNYST